jgi:hypothetical protein
MPNAAMRGMVEQLAKEMLVPGAVVLLRTPNGDFATTYGVTTYRCDEERLPSVTAQGLPTDRSGSKNPWRLIVTY